MQPDGSVIIVSWNTRTCLEKCRGARDPAAKGLATEVIVVDNGSRVGSQAMVSAHYPTARSIHKKAILGTAEPATSVSRPAVRVVSQGRGVTSGGRPGVVTADLL